MELQHLLPYPPGPDGYDIEQIDIGSVIYRLEKNPQDCNKPYDSNSSHRVIHLAIRYRLPYYVISKILEASPEAAEVISDDGNALSLADECQSPPEVIRLLVTSGLRLLGNEMIFSDTNPVDIDYRLETLRVILDVCPVGLVTPHWSCRTIGEFTCSPLQEVISNFCMRLTDGGEPFLNKIVLFIEKASELGLISSGPILHSILSIAFNEEGNNRSVFFPEDPQLRFIYGAEKSLLAILELIHDRDIAQFQAFDRRHFSPLRILIENTYPSMNTHRASQPNTHVDQIVDFLLSLCSRSADSIPIHNAVRNGWPVGAIIRSNPLLVIVVDRETNLYPFMTAAISVNSTLSTTYELLRADPSLI